ncbi:putative reverse transcriptase domain-containing protein [Tanacetum coccineum]|uniref:Reverse transcriptase domain-containing protein n=1 Tax=Tanacetum coccineum TaxID=301880 RepID=A0ABQ4X8N2_9ASTR
MSMTIQSGVKDKILATTSDTPKVENVPAEMLRDMDQQMEKRADDGKANVVTDALIRKERVKPRRVRAMAMTIQYGVRGMIVAAQSEPFKQENVSLVGSVMDKAHASRYLVHPGADKKYYNLRDMYWWPGMKRDIAIYVKSPWILSLNFQGQSSGYDMIGVMVNRLTKSPYISSYTRRLQEEKLSRINIYEIVARNGVLCTAYYPQMDGQSEHAIRTLEGMLKACVIDYGGRWGVHLPLAELSYNNSYHSSIHLIGPELVHETTDKVLVIKEKLQAARDRQKSYADSGRKMTEYEVGENVLVKVSPWKGVMRFGKKGKLALSYRLRFPEELIGVHDTFHVSNLKKCLGNANLHVPLNEIKIDKTLRFVEEPVEIMDREVKSLKRSRIPLVKVRWNSKHGPEFTWEREDYMKSKYPQLFVDRAVEPTS